MTRIKLSMENGILVRQVVGKREYLTKGYMSGHGYGRGCIGKMQNRKDKKRMV